eukprot:766501-Hanusia_phi.AAC.3
MDWLYSCWSSCAVTGSNFMPGIGVRGSYKLLCVCHTLVWTGGDRFPRSACLACRRSVVGRLDDKSSGTIEQEL